MILPGGEVALKEDVGDDPKVLVIIDSRCNEEQGVIIAIPYYRTVREPL